MFSLGYGEERITAGGTSPKAKGWVISCRNCQKILGILSE